MCQLKLSVVFMILVIFCFLDSTSTKRPNYCSRKLCGGKKHIACHNKGRLNKSCSPGARVIKLSRKTRKSIVRKHNRLRNKIARGRVRGYKRAKRMATMRWSKQLAKLAAYNVKQCTMRHDKCRNTPRFRFAGQNLAQHEWPGKGKSVRAIAREQIQTWFDERKQCSMKIINRLPIGGDVNRYGHFTAMVQEKNVAVGCAILRQKRNGNTIQLMACNYAYSNIGGKAVYRKGRTASKCKTGRNPRYKGLCSRKEKYRLKIARY